MKLNPQQRKAVEYLGGPLLIVAGAGTGKTAVITERIKWLIVKKGLTPESILAVTFTEKAAAEMEARVDEALPLGYSQLWISTFHSFCDRILRQHAAEIGLNPNFKLLTEAEAVLFLRQHLFEFNLDYYRPVSNPTRFLQGLVEHFSRLRDEDITPQQYLRFAKLQAQHIRNKQDELEAKKSLELASAFAKYQGLKEKEGVFDFADLISYTLALFRRRPNILGEYRKQFQFILVDEFQDTNIAQYELIKLLAPPERNPNLTVTGDDSQSIYKFRGAAISNILTFMDDYKNAKMVVLTKNYRSTQAILDASYRLISHNNPDTLEAKLGITKRLVAERRQKGKPIVLFWAKRVEDEAELVVKEIKKLSKIYQYREMAILVRANDHAEPFIRALSRSGIPYQFLGPGHLFRQPEIKDLIAYLKVLVDPGDNIAFWRVLSLPVFKLSQRDLAFLRHFAAKHNLTLFEAAEKVEENPALSPGVKKRIKKIVALVKRHLQLLPKESGGQILYYFVKDSGWLKILLNPKTERDYQRGLNVAKFFDQVKSFETEAKSRTVFDLLDWITLRLEMGESPLAAQTDWEANNAVNILTVHSAKGLEFPVVFLVNLVTRRFPTVQRREQIPIPQPLIKEILPEGNPHEQEERRLFYVAMTRARDRLYFTAASYYGEGKLERRISPFVVEALGEEAVKEALAKQPSKEAWQPSLLAWQKPPEEATPPLLTPPVTRLSFSQLDSFEICPLQYKYKYILKIPVLPSPSQTLGDIIHRTLKEFYQLLITTQKLPAVDKLLELLTQNWRSIGFRSKKHETQAKLAAQKMLTTFYQKEVADKPIPKILALEQPFSLRLAPTLKVSGIIDRVDLLPDGSVEIIDYKTGGRTPSVKDVAANNQLTLYALAAASIPSLSFYRPVEKIFLSLWYLQEGVKFTTQRTAAQLELLKKRLIQLAEEIEKSHFPAKPGTPFPCNYCEFRLLCEEWK